MIRKGQVRWLAKGGITEQIRFIEGMFGSRRLTRQENQPQYAPPCSGYLQYIPRVRVHES
jgi:hypothetical protein